MFSKDLEITIGQCYKAAREQRHEFMTVEHLLLALLDNASAIAVLRACSADTGTTFTIDEHLTPPDQRGLPLAPQLSRWHLERSFEFRIA